MSQNCTTGRLAVVGTGIEHDLLVQYAKQYTPTIGPGAVEVKAKYHAGMHSTIRYNGSVGTAHSHPL